MLMYFNISIGMHLKGHFHLKLDIKFRYPNCKCNSNAAAFYGTEADFCAHFAQCWQCTHVLASSLHAIYRDREKIIAFSLGRQRCRRRSLWKYASYWKQALTVCRCLNEINVQKRSWKRLKSIYMNENKVNSLKKCSLQR